MRRLILVLILLLWPARAGAHGVGVDCKVEGDQVQLEAYFDDDTPVAKARVRVVNTDDKIIAEGQTDDAGKWSFPRPAPGKYEVVVDAGAGHRRRTAITIPDPSAPTETPVRVSEGPSREEATRVPWLGILVGLLLIAVVGGLLQRVRQGPPLDRDIRTGPQSDKGPE